MSRLSLRSVQAAAAVLRLRLDRSVTSVLAAFSVAVGAFSVLGSLGAMSAVTDEFSAVLDGLDAESVVVQQYELDPGPDARPRPPLRYDDVARLQRARPDFELSAQAGVGRLTVRGRTSVSDVDVSVLAGDDRHTDNFSRDVLDGRALTADDLARRSPVVLLDERAADDLFGAGRAVGSRVRMGGDVFTVVGVLAGRRGMFGAAGLPVAVVPLTTAYARWGLARTVSHVSVRPSEGGPTRQALRDEVEGALRAVRAVAPEAPSDFAVVVNEEVLGQVETLGAALEWAALLLGAISLGVAGFGLGNLMTSRIQSQTVEIGVRRALGARQSDIVAEYLGEALLIAWIGAAAGALVSAGAIALGSLFLDVHAPFAWPWLGRVLALVTAVAVTFGAGPALRAARLAPTLALRTA